MIGPMHLSQYVENFKFCEKCTSFTIFMYTESNSLVAGHSLAAYFIQRTKRIKIVATLEIIKDAIFFYLRKIVNSNTAQCNVTI